MSTDQEAVFLKTMTLGAIAQAPIEVRAHFEQAMKDLNALAEEYLQQADPVMAIAAFALAIPVFVVDLGDKVEALREVLKKKAGQQGNS